MNIPNKLTKKEFYDIYGISILDNIGFQDKSWLLILLLEVAQKYYDITYYALGSELRHFFPHCFSADSKKFLRRVRISKKTWKENRRDLSLTKIYQIFNSGRWIGKYGGEAWANICLACIELKNAINSKEIKRICMAIDKLNDLEHNNSLYLNTYTTFNLDYSLYHKASCQEEEIFENCSDEVHKLYKEIKKGFV